ncbi:hypothetical protein CPB86DRAFT_52735 [Serendipita vermifera]|nr:hypothetical protein CPB86DRAFT_52735 [Serendipita vermifera]
MGAFFPSPSLRVLFPLGCCVSEDVEFEGWFLCVLVIFAKSSREMCQRGREGRKDKHDCRTRQTRRGWGCDRQDDENQLQKCAEIKGRGRR